MADRKVSERVKKMRARIKLVALSALMKSNRVKKMRERIRLAARGDEATAIVKKALYGPPVEIMSANPIVGIAM